MTIEIREVKTKSDLKTFIHLPEAIHAGQENWVHPIYLDEWKYFDRKKNKAFSYCDTLLLLAFKEGKAAGRVMGIINKRFNEYRKENIARFGYLETREDPEVFHALLARVEDWAPAERDDPDHRSLWLLRPGPGGLDHRGLRTTGPRSPPIIIMNGCFGSSRPKATSRTSTISSTRSRSQEASRVLHEDL